MSIWTGDPTWPSTPVSRAKHVIPIITRLSHDPQKARDRVSEDIRHDRTLPRLLDLGVQLGVKSAHRWGYIDHEGDGECLLRHIMPHGLWSGGVVIHIEPVVREVEDEGWRIVIGVHDRRYHPVVVEDRIEVLRFD